MAGGGAIGEEGVAEVEEWAGLIPIGTLVSVLPVPACVLYALVLGTCLHELTWEIPGKYNALTVREWDCPRQFALFGALLVLGSDAEMVTVVRLKHALPASCMLCKGLTGNLRGDGGGWGGVSSMVNFDFAFGLINMCDVTN